ncbi:MAG TPA: anhydro-N-acetylmuramic acid kinase [Rheinheimera sp.]|nr:anhydro-N-acetylmuramic acid kinase [Rheinheimera sp.]
MHPHIQQLYSLAAKPARRIIGLMSGTSLDGLDIALCELTGAGMTTSVRLLQFATMPYDDNYKQRVKAVFAKRSVDLQQVTLLNPWIATEHARLINQCLQQWQVDAKDIDLIASHGQTVFHAPKRQHQLSDYGNATLQLGDGDHLAVATGITVISDFRQKHIAAGGEGAPLAVYGDYLLFSSHSENRLLMNIGGIANFTWLPASQNAQAVFSSDIGPGNTMMDAYMQRHFSQHYDADAAVASSGKVSEPLLDALKHNDFFQLKFPKTTGPEVFNLAYLEQAQQSSDTEALSHADVMATLNRFTADMIISAISQTTAQLDKFVIYASGGGIHNPLLMQQLKKALPDIAIKTTADLGINPDAKEAVLFAVLANECVAGGKNSMSNAREGIPGVTMGKISFAD